MEYLEGESISSGVADALVVLCGGERPLHGEGVHGRTQPAKETSAGQSRAGLQEPTSLRGIAKSETMSLATEASPTEEPCEGKLHAGICAGGAGRPAFLPRRARISYKMEKVRE